MCNIPFIPLVRISTEHSPKLQIRSHSYLRAVSEVSINRSLDTLDPKTLLDPKSLLSSPQYRSRNESYMRAMSTISQVGCQQCWIYTVCPTQSFHPRYMKAQVSSDVKVFEIIFMHSALNWNLWVVVLTNFLSLFLSFKGRVNRFSTHMCHHLYLYIHNTVSP